MSVLVEFAIFPTDRGESKSEFVARVINMIRATEAKYTLTPMGTVIETETIREALNIIERAYQELEIDCNRIYSVVKIDYRKDKNDRMEQKIESVNKRLQSKASP
jgi:uncharacterized protein (TIGR00106 family)